MSETEQAAPAVKRGAIIGTASTYKSTPWGEPDLDILSLNDAYVLPGFARASGWFDLHPIPEMVFRPKGERRVLPQHAPVGGYLRPEGHLDWLKSRDFPVFLHDCREAGCAELPVEKRSHAPYDFPAWKNAQPFPFKAIQAQYGAYFSSTPAWMLAWMLLQGYNQIHIYGIHLATEWEYIHQRPNLEFLIGMALARGTQFVIPERSTLLRGKHQYAIEPKPGLDIEKCERRIMLLKHEGQQLQARLARLKWHQRGEAADIRARLTVLDLEVLDARQEAGRLQAVSRVA